MKKPWSARKSPKKQFLPKEYKRSAIYFFLSKTDADVINSGIFTELNFFNIGIHSITLESGNKIEIPTCKK